MPDANMLFIHALTGVHPGGGTALGVVDLPIQRERHTQWPMIAGASLKGVLRDACREAIPDRTRFHAVFGPETAHASDFAGALALTDARLLAFPVRSLRGVFAWVTCRAVVERLARDSKLLAGHHDPPPEAPAVSRGDAACSKGSELIIQGARLLLEEFEFRRMGADQGISGWIADRAVTDKPTAERLRRNLVILHEDDFTHFARHATEVIARVGLDYETKTARNKALFYEEFLPSETLLYSVALATDSRNKDANINAADILKILRDHAPKIMQIGADQTTGKGLCAVSVISHGGDR